MLALTVKGKSLAFHSFDPFVCSIAVGTILLLFSRREKIFLPKHLVSAACGLLFTARGGERERDAGRTERSRVERLRAYSTYN